MMYAVIMADGTVLARFGSKFLAAACVYEHEEYDRKNGIYTPNFYRIMEERS